MYDLPNAKQNYTYINSQNKYIDIEKVDEFNFLGLTIDTNLYWKKHTEKNTQKKNVKQVFQNYRNSKQIKMCATIRN